MNLDEFEKKLSQCRQLLIIVHNNPDPDAIASAEALRFLVENRSGVKVSIAYGGYIGRAENREMVRQLGIRLKQFNRIRLGNYDCIALVDTQPGAGNNSLPATFKCDFVIDHHPVPSGRKIPDAAVIEPDIGASATILIEWLITSELDIPVNLATALSYAISSETKNLHREAGKRDIQAYMFVYIRSSMRKLAQITNPKLDHSYFIILDKTLACAVTFNHLICAHLGDVPAVEIVPEMADFLLRHKRISWALCTGRFKDSLVLAVRSSNPKVSADALIKQLVPNTKNVGGHNSMAGGYIPITDNKKEKMEELERELSQNFAKQLGFSDVEWKPLIK